MYILRPANQPSDKTENNPTMLELDTGPIAPHMLLTFPPFNSAQEPCEKLTHATRHHHNAAFAFHIQRMTIPFDLSSIKTPLNGFVV